jgi:endonuclease/exonuclease/phosphatase family metal-dependent hydrolase
MVRTAGLIAAVAGLMIVGPVEGQDAGTLRVMTFNIRYGTAQDGEDGWEHRRDLLMRTIEAFGPSVLGVQEALRFQLDEITRALPRYALIGVGRDDGRDKGEFSAILYDSTRFDVVESGTFWYAADPGAVGAVAWGAHIPRICTWARLRDRTNGRVFRMYNSHYDHESQESREKSAALLLRRIGSIDATEAVIVTGDFNAGEDNAAFRSLVSNATTPLRDTFRAVHPEATSTGTFNGFKGDRSGPKIDAILVSAGWDILESGIDHTTENGRTPSDHYPVTAIIRRSR